MMINKRLIALMGNSKKYIFLNVLCQWLSLLGNMGLIAAICTLLEGLFAGELTQGRISFTLVISAGALLLRFACDLGSARAGFLSSKAVKGLLREKIFRKLQRLGMSYREQAQSSELVQVAVEGVDQLEIYFGAYLPQFFYATLAPLTLFLVLVFVDWASALVLLFCVPLIPVAIAAVQTWAKKLLSKYWGQYTALGDSFLENLQGLTTLKIYQADEFKNKQMNEEAEKFRKITMRVLTMQLNSISVMDIVAYGGAAAGIAVALLRFGSGHVGLAGCIAVILLAAEFFIPMRKLGSFFHVAMNGMAASDKIFRLLDLPDPPQGDKEVPGDCGIEIEKLSFSYGGEKAALENISMSFPMGSYTAVVGESGSGKSTLANILTGRNKNYSGSLKIGGIELSEISEKSLAENITYVGHRSYLFGGTVRDNLLMGRPGADDESLWKVLEQVKLSDFLKSREGLDTVLSERASNLSGGQCQRLALARALLHDSRVYIFDEAASNIDVESERDIMAEIEKLARSKTVILISHRLANVLNTDNIYLLRHAELAEAGSHSALMVQNGEYAALFNTQQELENYGMEVRA